MNRLEHLLTITGEEGSEIQGRTSKALRFGLNEVQPGQPLTNARRLVGECNDLLALLEMLHAEGVDLTGLGDRAEIAAKKMKVEKFLVYSREMGTLQ